MDEKGTESVEIMTREGDFVLRGGNLELLRFHVTEDDELRITSTEYRGMSTIASISDMKELRDWLTRRLEEPRP